MLPAFLEISRTAVSMCSAGLCLLVIGLLAARRDIAEAGGLDKIVALSNLCFAIPLAVFGAEHLSGARFIMDAVPAYMPWRLFWAYFVGFALLAASLSIATKIQLRWSGLLFGVMMLLFVALIHVPGALANVRERIPWVIVFREMSFAGGAWMLATTAMQGQAPARKTLFTVGRVLIGITAVVFGVEHFFHPVNVPGVPLEKLMPTWVPGGPLIDYLTGVILIVAGVSILISKNVRRAATYLGAWILILVILIYGPILAVSLSDASTAVKVEGINYFADTLLFAGVMLALASGTAYSQSHPLSS
jgi:uncharacterized membrane protein